MRTKGLTKTNQHKAFDFEAAEYTRFCLIISPDFIPAGKLIAAISDAPHHHAHLGVLLGPPLPAAKQKKIFREIQARIIIYIYIYNNKEKGTCVVSCMESQGHLLNISI